MKNKLKKEAKIIYTRHQEKFRYLVAGLINTTIGLCVFPILYLIFADAGIGYLNILLVAQFICITFSFLTNKYYAFKSSGDTKKEYIKFFLIHIFFVLLNIIILPLIVDGLDLNPIIAQTLFTVPVIIIGYLWHKYITFKIAK